MTRTKNIDVAPPRSGYLQPLLLIIDTWKWSKMDKRYEKMPYFLVVKNITFIYNLFWLANDYSTEHKKVVYIGDISSTIKLLLCVAL